MNCVNTLTIFCIEHSMINILHAIDTGGPGGAETVFLNIISGLDKTQFQSCAVLPGKGWLSEQLIEKGIDPIFINSKGSFNFKYLFNLARHAKKLNIDIIHSHLFGSNVYCSLIGLFLRIPVISTFHGYVDTDKADNLLKLKFKIIGAGSKKIVFVSEHLKKYFLNYMNTKPNMTTIIYNGVDTAHFKPRKTNLLKRELGLGDNDILIGCIGNIRPPKGYDILLRAAAQVKDVRKDCKFVIAGEGSGALYDELLNLKKELNLQDTVFFLGFRDDPEFLLNNFDIFLLPSTSEGFSISTIEAMACMKPVIATMSGGPEEIIRHNKNGILISPEKPSDITDALIHLLSNEGERKAIASCGYEKLQYKFSSNILVENYEELYRASIRATA